MVDTIEWRNDPSKLIGALQEATDIKSTQSLDNILSKLTQELYWALYLWLGWVFPDGVWKPGSHWSGQHRYRNDTCNRIWRELENSWENLQGKIDEIFQPWREHFPDSEYAKIPDMLRLLFVLKKTRVFNHNAMNILDEVTDAPWFQLAGVFDWERKILWNADLDRSYTEEQKKSRKERELADKEEEVQKKAEKSNNLKRRLREHLANKWICPDCKKQLGSCDCDMPF